MSVSVVVPTYKRAWSLPYLLDGLVRQIAKPDEVIIVLKQSGDGSEKIIRDYEGSLNIRLLLQTHGYAINAYAMGIREAGGDIVLLIDDDAIPHPEWVQRYKQLFSELPDAGAIGGLTYKAYLINGSLQLTNESLFDNEVTKNVFYRKPLKELADYCRYLSISGLPAARGCKGGIFKSVLLSGANMGFRRDAVKGFNLEELYKGSRRAFHFEPFIAYYIIKKGFKSYHVIDVERAPIAWHIMSHRESLTRSGGFKGEFWLHFDRASMYFRLRRIGANVSFIAWLVANIAIARKKTLPRILASTYALLYAIAQALRS
ncbi:MAG: glycosyltransferase family 2 protein [Vulcanisaeta sp.]